MPTYTRKTRTVRITSADGKFFADVEILLVVSLNLPNNLQISYKLDKPIKPFIYDTTGDGNEKVGDKTSTRSSHMQRLTGLKTPNADGKDNSSQFFDVEVCDGFTVTGPNNTQHYIDCAAIDASWQIVDDTNSGLDGYWNYGATKSATGAPPGGDTRSQLKLIQAEADAQTRCGHVVRYTQQTGKTGSTLAPPDNPKNYAYGLICDCMTFDGPPFGMPYVTESAPSTSSDLPMQSEDDDNDAPQWSDYYGLVFETPDHVIHGALQPDALCNDVTAYTTDPDTGLRVPPPPSPDDLNIYVYWPGRGNKDGIAAGNTKGAVTGGPWLGGGSAGQGLPPPAIDMGPLWWIRQLGSNVNVWYWYINPVQTPKAWSFFGGSGNGAGGSWGYRGFTWLPDFPVIWILSINNPLVTMGPYGAPTLEQAARGHSIGSTLTVNWAGLGIPDGGWAVNTTKAEVGGLGVGLPIIGYTGYTYYMPYGAFDLVQGTSAERLQYAASAVGQAAWDAAGGNPAYKFLYGGPAGSGYGSPQQYGAANDAADSAARIYTDYGGPGPNIWELTGLPQPPLTNTGLSWDPNNNPHLQPSIDLAKQVVTAFISNWNKVAISLNNAQLSTGGDAVTGWPFVPPPDWTWNRPYGGDTVGTAQMFSNGWVPAVLPQVTVPAYIPTLAADQLDDSVWNNQIVLDTNGTSPPVLWTTGVP